MEQGSDRYKVASYVLARVMQYLLSYAIFLPKKILAYFFTEGVKINTACSRPSSANQHWILQEGIVIMGCVHSIGICV